MPQVQRTRVTPIRATQSAPTRSTVRTPTPRLSQSINTTRSPSRTTIGTTTRNITPPPSLSNRTGYTVPSRVDANRAGVTNPGTSITRSSTTTPITTQRQAYQPPRAVGAPVRTRYRTPVGTSTSSTSSVNSRNLYNRVSGTTRAGQGSVGVAQRSGPLLDSARLNERYRTQLQPARRNLTSAAPTRAQTDQPAAGRSSALGDQPRLTERTAERRTTSSIARTIRGTADNHYARPGSEARGRLATTAARSGSSRSVALSTGTARAGVSTLYPVTGPRLTNTVRSAVLDSGYVGSYGSAFNAGLSFSFGFGCGGFGLSFGFGSGFGCPWGFYGYPFYYGCYWPYYRYQYYCRPYYYGYGYGYPYYSRLWYWPSSVYAPTYYGGYYDSYPSTVVVREVVASDAPEEEAVEVGAEESLAKLADRFVALGDFYFREGRFSEAAEAYARARTYAPDDATIHFVLSDALFAIGDYHFAAFLISEALRLEPELARAEADKTTFYSDPAVFAEQMDTLARYLAEKPYDAAAHLVNGYNLRFSGRPEEAKIAFRRVLEIEPGNQAARTFLDALESGGE